eukprot:239436-Pyramimonas_sp.AAC.1
MAQPMATIRGEAKGRNERPRNTGGAHGAMFGHDKSLMLRRSPPAHPEATSLTESQSSGKRRS